MKYIIDGEHEFNDVHEAADYISENVDDNEYEEYLNNIYPEIELCGATYLPAQVLFEVDRVNYYCCMTDWRSNVYDKAENSLESMDDGDEENIYGFTVEAVEDDEESEEE